MKIMLFTLEYPPQIGGVADYYRNMVEFWPLKEECLVYDTNLDKRFKSSTFINWPKLAIILKRKIKKNKINHVLVGHILPLGAITYLASFFTNFSYSVCLHGLDFNSAIKKRRKRIISCLILGRAKKIICANSYLADNLKKWQPKLVDKIVIVNPGAEVQTAQQSLVLNLQDKLNLKGKKIIFSLARLVARKGFDKVIDALSVLKENNPLLFNKIIYLLAGQGEDEERLKKIVKHRGLDDKVIFLGQINQADKFAYFQIADVFCMPSRQIGIDFEGFGIVYLEANLFKKPVIAGSSGGVADAVIDRLNGLLVNPYKLDELVEAIEMILTNEQLAKKLGENGYWRAKNDFNWSNQAKKLRNYLLVS